MRSVDGMMAWQIPKSAFLLSVFFQFSCSLSTSKDPKDIRWTEAKVEVSLGGTDAFNDAHGHASIRGNSDSSVIKIFMDNVKYELNLTQTSWLVAPGASIRRVGVGVWDTYSPINPRPCLYLAYAAHTQPNQATTGTLSLCHQDGPRVVLLIGDEVAELLPRGPSDIAQPPAHGLKRGGQLTRQYTHVVKRHPLPAVMDQDCQNDVACERSTYDPIHVRVPDFSQDFIQPTIEDVKRGEPVKADPLHVELGLFIDEALLNAFQKHLTSEEEIVDLVLGLVNNVQALYRHPSLGRRVDLTITHLRLLNTQPEDLPTHRGDRIKLLKSFCEYNQRNNNPDDSSPDHWDIGIYLSGLNFYVKNADGTENGVTMGLAYTGGVCKPALSCVINELGAVNYRGRPYPSAGALSSYVLAHEIGHSLGLRHDGVSNSCSHNGYIMAAGRGLRGATTWSTCAKEKILLQKGECLWEEASNATALWDHSKFRGLPGQRWDAIDQCRLFLKDDQATLKDIADIKSVCESVQCVSPTKMIAYLAGPALEGTHCGGTNWCRGGECVPWGSDGPLEVVPGGWGSWVDQDCRSGCVVGGSGYMVSTRKCDSPPPKNSIEGCVGSEVKVTLCPDDKVCGLALRRPVRELASELCVKVAALKNDILPVGHQMAYSAEMDWQACALYCEKRNSSTLWTPRYEFKHMPNVPTHLPDGTPCNSGEYVCFNRVCVPPDLTVANNLLRSDLLLPKDIIEQTTPDDYPSIDLDDLYS